MARVEMNDGTGLPAVASNQFWRITNVRGEYEIYVDALQLVEIQHYTGWFGISRIREVVIGEYTLPRYFERGDVLSASFKILNIVEAKNRVRGLYGDYPPKKLQ